MSNICNKINQYKSQIKTILDNNLSTANTPNDIIQKIITALHLTPEEISSLTIQNTQKLGTTCANGSSVSQSNIIDNSPCSAYLGCGNRAVVLGSVPKVFKLKPDFRQQLVNNYGEQYANDYQNYLLDVCAFNNNTQKNISSGQQSCVVDNIMDSINTTSFNPIGLALIQAISDYTSSNTTAPFNCNLIPTSMSDSRFSGILQACIQSSNVKQANSMDCVRNGVQSNVNKIIQSCTLSSMVDASPPSQQSPQSPQVQQIVPPNPTPAQDLCIKANNIKNTIPSNWTSDPKFLQSIFAGIGSVLNTDQNNIKQNISNSSMNLGEQICSNTANVDQSNTINNLDCYKELNCGILKNPNAYTPLPGESLDLHKYKLNTLQKMCQKINDGTVTQSNNSNAQQNCVINNTISLLKDATLDERTLGLYQMALGQSAAMATTPNSCASINSNITSAELKNVYQKCANKLNLTQKNYAVCTINVDQSNENNSMQTCLLESGIFNSTPIPIQNPIPYSSTSITTSTPQSQPTPVPNKSYTWVIVLLIILFLIFIGIIIYLKK